MDKAQTGPRPDAAKRRREYLAKKVTINSVEAFGLAVSLGGVGGSLLLLMGMQADPLLFLGAAIVAVNFGYFGWRTRGWASQKDRRIPYVPPVAEHLAALLAEEILVRGSDQPAATLEELLRAAREGGDSGSEELMRASKGQVNSTRM